MRQWITEIRRWFKGFILRFRRRRVLKEIYKKQATTPANPDLGSMEYELKEVLAVISEIHRQPAYMYTHVTRFTTLDSFGVWSTQDLVDLSLALDVRVDAKDHLWQIATRMKERVW